MSNERIIVKCDKCGEEYSTRLWEPGQKHKGCGGEFKPNRYSINYEVMSYGEKDV